MPEDEEGSANICDLPTEILLHIFTYLPGRQLSRSRGVCVRWKNIIDQLAWSDVLWREHCLKDFPKVYREARIQSQPDLLYFHIYRSLSLWPKLSQAREIQDEFAPASVYDDVIMNAKVLANGIIGVHKQGAIKYYDIETLELSKRPSIPGDYARWTENGDTVVILGYYWHLFIIRKIVRELNFEVNVTYIDVKFFILVNREVYYVTIKDDIYVVDLEDGSLRTKLIKHCSEPVMCLSYTDRLNILTYERKIYSVEDGDLILAHDLEDCTDILHQLHRFNLLATVHWQTVYEWQCLHGIRILDMPLKHIVTVKPYGDVVFVGCQWGVLRIYYKPFVDGKFDFYHCEPMKQYNFMERPDCPVLTNQCSILKVDVSETEEGHKVIVAMPKKIAVINFIHNFKRTASVAMLPYSDVQRVKLLKIDELHHA